MSWWSTLTRIRPGLFLDADNIYYLKGINDTRIRLGELSFNVAKNRNEYKYEGITRLGDGSEVLTSGGYKISSNPDIYRIDATETGKGVDLPTGTQLLSNGKFKLPDGTEIPGNSKKMIDGTFQLPDGNYKLTNTSFNKIKQNKTNVNANVDSGTDIKTSSDKISGDTLTLSDNVVSKIDEMSIKKTTINNRARSAENALNNRKTLGEVNSKKIESDYEKIKKKRMDAIEKALGLIGLAALIGGLMMDKSADANASEERKGCVTACLPHNYSDYFHGKINKGELKYTTMSSLRAEFPNAEFPEDQPFCQEGNDDCYEHCTAACFNKYKDQEGDGDGDGDDDEEPWWKKWFPDVDENLITSVIVAILAVIIIAFLIMIFSLYSS